MQFVFNDGGRSAAGFKGVTGDCVTRAIAIATEIPYEVVYKSLSEGVRGERRSTSRADRQRSARNGVQTSRQWFKDYMRSIGWRWTPTMRIGGGCQVHLRSSELPGGRIIVSTSKHYCAVIDGVIHDIADPSRDGSRCVYGYWSREVSDEA